MKAIVQIMFYDAYSKHTLNISPDVTYYEVGATFYHKDAAYFIKDLIVNTNVVNNTVITKIKLYLNKVNRPM